MKKPTWLIGASLPILVISFQNCGNQVTFDEALSKSDLEPVAASSIDDSHNNEAIAPEENQNLPEDEVSVNEEGPRQSQLEVDERVDPKNSKKECTEGQEMLVYIDPQGDGMIREENYLGSFVSFEGEASSAENYNYYSHSAHPIMGPSPSGFEANIFMYEGSDGLALNFFANIDNGGSDGKGNKFDMDISIEDNSLDDRVILSDDNAEIKEVSDGRYEGRFWYKLNTDGGVIGPLNPADSFKIRVQFKTTGDVQKARFHSANGVGFSLSTKAAPVNDFIITNNKYVECKMME